MLVKLSRSQNTDAHTHMYKSTKLYIAHNSTAFNWEPYDKIIQTRGLFM